MAFPKAYIIARWISVEAINPEFKPLLEIILQILQSHLTQASPEEIAERAEEIFEEVFEELKTFVADSINDGVRPRFEISGESTDAYLRGLEAPELDLFRKLKLLTPDDLETFCANLLSRLGALSHRTGKRDDGGVDFIGFNLPLCGAHGAAVPRSSNVLVIGQAKRYKESLVTETEIREFIGGAVYQSHNIKNTSVEIGVMSPIVFAFWTTSEFHPTAKRYAKDMGIWYLGGIALAQLAYQTGMVFH